MLYASQHLSLACLEVLVHLDKSELPPEYVLSTALLSRDPDSLATEDLSSENASIQHMRTIETSTGAAPGPFVLIPGCSPLGPSPTNEQPLYFPGILCPELPVMTADR